MPNDPLGFIENVICLIVFPVSRSLNTWEVVFSRKVEKFCGNLKMLLEPLEEVQISAGAEGRWWTKY